MASLFELTVGEETKWRNTWKKARLTTEMAREILNEDNAEMATEMVETAKSVIVRRHMHDFFLHGPSAHDSPMAALEYVQRHIPIEVEAEPLKKMRAYNEYGIAKNCWKDPTHIGFFVAPKTLSKVTFETVHRYASLTDHENAAWWHVIHLLEAWAFWRRSGSTDAVQMPSHPSVHVLNPFLNEDPHTSSYFWIFRPLHKPETLCLKEMTYDSIALDDGPWSGGARFLMTHE